MFSSPLRYIPLSKVSRLEKYFVMLPLFFVLVLVAVEEGDNSLFICTASFDSDDLPASIQK